MRKKVICSGMLFLALLAVVPVVLMAWGFLIPPQFDKTFLGGMRGKYLRLKETEGKRIVVIGGSGTAFALRCDLVEAELPEYKAVNFGMYASLGTKVMLDISRDWIRPGDIVLVAPEEDAQTLSLYFNGEAAWQAADGSPELLMKISPENRSAMLGRFPAFAADKFRYRIAGNKPEPEGVYRSASFNVHGDIDFAGRGQNTMPNGWDTNHPINLTPEMVSEDFLDYLNAWACQVQSRGAEVYFYFCPMNVRAIADYQTEALEAWYDWLAEKLQFPILGNPEHSVMDAEWFYDTNFHLNASGAQLYTRRVVQDLKLLFRDASPTQIPRPPKPDFAHVEYAVGDDSNAACFLWREENGSAILTGLTEAGQQAQSLILPTHCGGLEVTGFLESLFWGNRQIQRISIQSNIRTIPDGAFSGCTALRELVMLSDRPESTVPGSELLEGTSCTILVPPDALGNYRTNYFWQVYAGRIEQSA